MQSGLTRSGLTRGPRFDWRNWLASPLAHLQLLLILAVMLGGGGVAYGFRNFAIQFGALLIVWWHRELAFRFLREERKPLIALLAMSMALPLIYLIPLPAWIWQALPGRALVVDAYAIAGLSPDIWAPLSLDRGRTLLAFCGTLAPAVIIIIGTGLSPKHKAVLAWTIVGGACAALFLGIGQISVSNTSGLLFPITPKIDVLYASFANRNSTALFFVLAICTLAAVPFAGGRGGLLASLAVAVLLAIGVVLTQSRSGMALLALSLGFIAVRFLATMLGIGRGNNPLNSKAMILGGLIGVAAILAVAVSAVSGGRAANSLERFTDSSTDRPEMWEDGYYAAQQVWPIGSGTGTFDEVFQLYESLEYVSSRRAGRAHNDILELGMETGVFGLLIAMAWIAWIVHAGFRGPSISRWSRLGFALGLGCIVLQSVLDYPLRNQTLLCFAGVLIVLLAQSGNSPQRLKKRSASQ